MSPRPRPGKRAAAHPTARASARPARTPGGGDLARRLAEALEQQAATREILRVVHTAPGDPQPVFEMIAERAMRLCSARHAGVLTFDGTLIHLAALVDADPALTGALRRTYPRPPGWGTSAARAILTHATVHIPDIEKDRQYEVMEAARAAGLRSALAVPMLRDGRAIGAIVVLGGTASPFSEQQIRLLETFADQAVIALENARLFAEREARNRELTEALEQQTATGEILRVISGSPTDVQPVFEAIAAAATSLCAAENSGVFLFDGALIHLAAHHSWTDGDLRAVHEAFPRPPGVGSVTARAILTRAIAHTEDLAADPEYEPSSLVAAGFRAVLSVPMLRDGDPIGAITVTRRKRERFTDTQIRLLETFARQAVIAIQNVRLFTELQEKNRALTRAHGQVTEALEQQMATGEILHGISSSPTDVQPVFDTIARNARRLCRADSGGVFTYDGERIHLQALDNTSPEGADALRQAYPMTASLGTAGGRAVLTGMPVHIADVWNDRDYELPGVTAAGLRSVLTVPMLRDHTPVGCITVHTWMTPRPFTDTQVELLKTFADQAVIAIENVRLFTELEARNRALTESLEQQTATSEILRVISSSPTDVQPVFDAIVRSAVRLCDARNGTLYRRHGDMVDCVAHCNVTPGTLDLLRRAFPRPVGVGGSPHFQRVLLQGAVISIPDAETDADLPPRVLAVYRDHGIRSVVMVPLVRQADIIGVLVVGHARIGAFAESHVELLKTFADQAVIAIENVRMFTELEARTRDLTRSVGELRALGEVSRAVGSTLDLETVLATIVSRAVELSASYGGIVYEFEAASQTFHARATHRISPEQLEVLRTEPVRLGEGAVGRAGVIHKPVEVADIEGAGELLFPRSRTLLAREGMGSLLAVPLVREGQLLGGLVIVRRERGAFSPEVVATLQTFATQSVLAIHNARLFREMERQRQYSEALVETSPVAIATVDLDGTVLGWNPGAERLFGYTSAEAIGRTLDELVATPDTRDEVRVGVRQGQRVRMITRRARKDGTPVDVEVSAMPVVVDGAQVGVSIVIYHDITELLQARREAETANEAKSAFLATMSHEIRTPMNAVIGMSGLLLDTALTDEQREYAEVVRQSGDALLTVINDVLDFSKIEAGKLELESQPFDLRGCVESALDLVATRAAEKGLDLAYVIGDGSPAAIVGDVTRLRQVLLNLLSNAVKFTERGEVVLTVSARSLESPPALHELTFSVRDTGIGIPRDRVDRLFQSFSQVDASTTRRYGGTGLGLAISQRLTELMGGRIGVTSEVGGGSEFRFTIRAPAAESPVASRRDLTGVQPSLRGKRVLVVDDNATNRRILTAHLDAWGMQARSTGSPTEALEWVRAGEGLDVGILDMHMPEMDGVTLAHAIRESRAASALPLILFTSLGRREARAESEGFAAYLNKPIKPSQLFDALVSVLPDQPIHVPQRSAARSELDPDMARRHPLRILLAEDNVVNQKLALRLLAQMGYRADLAANGLEAVDAVERQTYDVVLMDVQMPEMDGLEASREIVRRWPGERRPRLVAMTANAMQGDRELCTAAGMDDYVAKPIRVAELIAALEQCRWRPDGGERRVPAPSAIDGAAVTALAAAMGGPFVAELIDTFVADGRELVATLRRTLAAADLEAFRRAAHSLKSNGETLGATGLARLARELETLARGGSLEGAGERLDPLAREYETAAGALEELRRDLPA